VVHYKNLKSEELGVLLIALGQDPNAQIALKLSGGRPIGMGTMTVNEQFFIDAAHFVRGAFLGLIGDRITISPVVLAKFKFN
jgi:hypothetical protein